MRPLPTRPITAEEVTRLVAQTEGTPYALDPFRDFERVDVPLSALKETERRRELRRARGMADILETVTRYRIRAHAHRQPELGL